MPDLLLELFSEEIPARMQGQAAADLKRLVTDALVARGLVYEGAAGFATPRRLALHIAGVPVRQPDAREEKRGPRVGAPEAAIQGFLKSAGLASIEEARIEPDPKGKGAFYVAVQERRGRETIEILAEILPAAIRGFPWPKSMRWGAASAKSDSLRWVRPLHGIVATFGPETEEPDVVAFEVGGLKSGDVTFGHRFMAPSPIRVRRFDDYAQALTRAKVVLDSARRRDMILHDARDLALAQGLELVEDDALLEEVAGLVEWPVVLLGSFDPAFLAIPPEAIRATIRANQKCFVLRRPDGALADKFLLVSNIEASDGGRAIAAGNARVVRARLSDAKFFWDADLKTALEDRLPKLETIVFHEKLGTQGERMRRIVALARELAPIVGADPEKAARAARLAKADLVTEMVGEFPELQGLMGRTYAIAQGEDADVAAAIEEHYKPQGPNDRVPTQPVSIAVALADKLDTLVGFWAIDEKPTGSKDPYALRRAALGVIRIVLENGVRLGLCEQFSFAHQRHLRRARHALRLFVKVSDRDTFRFLKDWDEPGKWSSTTEDGELIIDGESWDLPNDRELFHFTGNISENNLTSLQLGGQFGLDELLEHSFSVGNSRELPSQLLSFIIDRLKVYLRDKGARHDLIDAAIGASASPSPFETRGLRRAPQGEGEGTIAPRSPHPEEPRSGVSKDVEPRSSMPPHGEEPRSGVSNHEIPDDLLMIVRRVEALGRFLDTDDGKSLLAGYKRAANILRIEEKKDGAVFNAEHDPDLLSQPEEKLLASAIRGAAENAAHQIATEDFEGAMSALAQLREPVDVFFDKVTVNDPDPALRSNRLRLLNELRRAMHGVADFSKIGG